MNAQQIINLLSNTLQKRYPEYWDASKYTLSSPWYEQMIEERKNRFTDEIVRFLAFIRVERVRKYHASTDLKGDDLKDIEKALKWNTL